MFKIVVYIDVRFVCSTFTPFLFYAKNHDSKSIEQPLTFLSCASSLHDVDPDTKEQC